MPTPPFFLVKTRDRVLAVQAPGVIIIVQDRIIRVRIIRILLVLYRIIRIKK